MNYNFKKLAGATAPTITRALIYVYNRVGRDFSKWFDWLAQYRIPLGMVFLKQNFSSLGFETAVRRAPKVFAER